MIYNDYELSKRLSNPIELFEFSDGVNNWRYCNGTETAFVFGGNTYTPAVIKRDGINYSQNSYDDKIGVTVPASLGISIDTINRFQETKIYLRIYRIQNMDVANYTTLWYGAISDFIRNDTRTEIKVESVASALEKMVVKNRATTQCRNILFSTECGLVEIENKTDGVITLIEDEVNISAAIFNTGVPNRFVSSIIVTEDGERRTIVTDPGNGIVTIVRPFKLATTGTAFYATAKCDRTITGLCTATSNTANFRGCTFMTNNPYKAIKTTTVTKILNPIT